MSDQERKRPVIAFFCGNYHTDHPRRLVALTYRIMKDQDVDVRYYLQTESQGFLETELAAARYDYQYASLPCYACYDTPDVNIISFGTILIYQKEWVLSNFLDVLPKAPAVVMECETDRQDCVPISCDNEAGMKMMTEHLILEHHVKRPAFITGPMQNPEAKIRYQVFMDTCKRLGVDVPESRIVYGDFSKSIGPLIEDLLKREPDIDALISSNDEMARAAAIVLQRHGLQIGKDILLTGFDNAIFSTQMDPKLSTVDQNYPDLVKTAADAALDLVRGHRSGPKKVKPILRLRESCGCHESEEEEQSLLDTYQRQEQYSAKSWSNSLLLREILLSSASIGDFLRTLGQQIAAMGCAASWVCLLQNPTKVEDNGILKAPDEIYLCMRQEGSEVASWNPGEGPACKTGGNLSFLTGDRPRQTFTFLLFYQDLQYGTFTVECTPEDTPHFYGLSVEIGTGLMVQHLLQDLRDKNQILDFEAEHDNLTGLYNRTALISRTLSMVHKNPAGTYVAVMADLDHLKQINDTFGHLEGDFAIRKAAAFLINALPEGTLIGRIGGDEFLCFFSGNEETVQQSLRYLKKEIDDFDRISPKPYYIGISCGYVLFDARGAENLQEIFSLADSALYEGKKTRRSDVIRAKISVSVEKSVCTPNESDQ